MRDNGCVKSIMFYTMQLLCRIKQRFIVVNCIALSVFLMTSTNVRAESKTLSWDPVTTYTDSLPIDPIDLPMSYDAWWSTSNTFVTPRYLLQNLTPTSVTFDIITEGMQRGTTIYFGAKSRTSTGKESEDSSPYPWLVPTVTPPLPAFIPMAPGSILINR